MPESGKKQSTKKQSNDPVPPEPDETEIAKTTEEAEHVVAPTRGLVTVVGKSTRDAALEAIRPSDGSENAISLPRIVVLQSLSREVTRDEEPLQAGFLFNRLTKEIVGEGGKVLDFIPLLYFPQRIRIELGAGLRCRSINLRTAQMMGGLTVDNKPTDNCGLCKLKEWPRDRAARGEIIPEDKLRRGPECSLTENFPALMCTGFTDPADYELIILSFSRTSMQAAKDLRGNYAISGKDWWANKYKLVVQRATGGPQNSVYFRQEVRRAGKPTPEEKARAEQMVAFLAGRDIVTDLDTEEGEMAGAPTTVNADAANERAF